MEPPDSHNERIPKAPSPAVRRKFIDFDPTAPDSVSSSQFCQELGISRRVFYTIRTRSHEESSTALHPHSSVPLIIRRRYGENTTRELICLREKLKAAGWDHGPILIRHEAINEGVMLDNLLSAATIDRSLRAVSGGVQPEETPRDHPGAV